MTHLGCWLMSPLLVLGACGAAADPEPEPTRGAETGGKADGAGARATISIEVDFVGSQRFEPGTIERLTSYFDSIGFAIQFVQDEALEPVDVLEVGTGSPMLAGYYRDHFGHRGQPGWHYMLMADSLAYANRGWGMIGGDMFEISADPVQAYPDHRTEAQANIILHELGHNLGLVHAGFEPELGAGTHDLSTCATADTAPSPDVPVTSYSPNCVEHIQLASRPYLTK